MLLLVLNLTFVKHFKGFKTDFAMTQFGQTKQSCEISRAWAQVCKEAAEIWGRHAAGKTASPGILTPPPG